MVWGRRFDCWAVLAVMIVVPAAESLCMKNEGAGGDDSIQMAMLLCFGRLGGGTVSSSSSQQEPEGPDTDECRSTSAVLTAAPALHSPLWASLVQPFISSFGFVPPQFLLEVYVETTTLLVRLSRAETSPAVSAALRPRAGWGSPPDLGRSPGKSCQDQWGERPPCGAALMEVCSPREGWNKQLNTSQTTKEKTVQA